MPVDRLSIVPSGADRLWGVPSPVVVSSVVVSSVVVSGRGWWVNGPPADDRWWRDLLVDDRTTIDCPWRDRRTVGRREGGDRRTRCAAVDGPPWNDWWEVGCAADGRWREDLTPSVVPVGHREKTDGLSPSSVPRRGPGHRPSGGVQADLVVASAAWLPLPGWWTPADGDGSRVRSAPWCRGLSPSCRAGWDGCGRRAEVLRGPAGTPGSLPEDGPRHRRGGEIVLRTSHYPSGDRSPRAWDGVTHRP
ncbi:MAG TPA: hypothetical protein VID75_10495 [Acidimicrobiales bacterium]